MRNNAGFTLLEIAIAVAIFGVLAAIAVPDMIRWRNDATLRSATDGLAGDMAVAKQAAIRSNANAVVTFTTLGYTIFIDDGSGGGSINDGVRNGTERTLRDVLLPPGVAFDVAGSTFADASTRFSARGLCQSSGSITLFNSYARHSISINRIGRVKTL